MKGEIGFRSKQNKEPSVENVRVLISQLYGICSCTDKSSTLYENQNMDASIPSKASCAPQLINTKRNWDEFQYGHRHPLLH